MLQCLLLQCTLLVQGKMSCIRRKFSIPFDIVAWVRLDLPSMCIWLYPYSIWHAALRWRHSRHVDFVCITRTTHNMHIDRGALGDMRQIKLRSFQSRPKRDGIVMREIIELVSYTASGIFTLHSRSSCAKVRVVIRLSFIVCHVHMLDLSFDFDLVIDNLYKN